MIQVFYFYLIVIACGSGSTFIIRTIAIRFGIVNKPNPIIPQHVKPVAYLGGIGIFFGIAAGLIIAYCLMYDFYVELKKSLPPLPALAIGSTAFLIWGIVDDMLTLDALPKFIGQVIISVISVLLGIRANIFDNTILDFLFSSFWILFVVNALNFTDVCDGLVGSICCATFFMAGIHLRDLRIFCFLISASTFGFLFFNTPRASIFMGDAGSHMLGFLLASTGILKSRELLFFDALVWMVLLASLPVFELLFITTMRIRKGMPWWKGSPDHFSLRLQAGKFTRWQIDILSAMVTGIIVGFACKLNSLGLWLKISLPLIILAGYLVFARFLMRWEVKRK